MIWWAILLIVLGGLAGLVICTIICWFAYLAMTADSRK